MNSDVIFTDCELWSNGLSIWIKLLFKDFFFVFKPNVSRIHDYKNWYPLNSFNYQYKIQRSTPYMAFHLHYPHTYWMGKQITTDYSFPLLLKCYQLLMLPNMGNLMLYHIRLLAKWPNYGYWGSFYLNFTHFKLGKWGLDISLNVFMGQFDLYVILLVSSFFL